ncbi:MAG: hypothetical protein IPJ76_15295 [Flavobacteriales bacterium]|nr:MAG: hypothetical protein IPJ76_15295 [Flavobacteriales bacterium]
MRTLLASLLLLMATAALAQKPIYAYAIGNWRNGPTVQMTDVFVTSERFTTEQIMERVMKEYGSFKHVADHDLLLFTDSAEAMNNQRVLVHKYAQRKLGVQVRNADGTMVQEIPQPMPSAVEPKPVAPIPAAPAKP